MCSQSGGGSNDPGSIFGVRGRLLGDLVGEVAAVRRLGVLGVDGDFAAAFDFAEDLFVFFLGDAVAAAASDVLLRLRGLLLLPVLPLLPVLTLFFASTPVFIDDFVALFNSVPSLDDASPA